MKGTERRLRQLEGKALTGNEFESMSDGELRLWLEAETARLVALAGGVDNLAEALRAEGYNSAADYLMRTSAK
ncbi:MAG TPA: hypothetical protein VIF34_10155 [Methylocystis sp.]|jgi:hypothetical protein